MKEIKRFPLIMLPTDGGEIVHISKGSCANTLVEKKYYGMIDKEMGDTGQSLYVLSDEKIKEGDYCISAGLVLKNIDNTVINGYKLANSKLPIYKIVATTDSSLIVADRISHGKEAGKEIETLLFHLPESFNSIFIKAYNDGTPIAKIPLEIVVGMCKQCEGACHAPICTDCHLCHGKAPYFLKIDSNGCVVVAKKYAVTLKVVDQYTDKDADIYMESDKPESLADSADKLIQAMSMMVNMSKEELAEIAKMVKTSFDEKQREN